MAKIGYGYGSECHLLRYLGRHRKRLDAKVTEIVGASRVEWLDFGFRPKRQARDWPDVEWKGLDFLPDDSSVKRAWRRFWPQRGNVPNWDALGRVWVNGKDEWLLVKAKAHLGELKSDSGAMSTPGVSQTVDALNETKRALGVAKDRDWLKGYYQ